MQNLNIEIDEDKYYRGSIPLFLLNNKNKKIIYLSTSNRNLENYHYSLSKKYNGNLNLFENISSNNEDMVGININLLNILQNEKKYLVFVNLQIGANSYFIASARTFPAPIAGNCPSSPTIMKIVSSDIFEIIW